MTLTTLLLVTSLALVAYFALYWLLLHGLALSQLFRSLPPTKLDSRSRGGVAVLVPAHHEGAAVVDTVRTLVAQDYEGRVEVYILVETLDDSCVAALRAALPTTEATESTSVELRVEQGNRRVHVVATGHRAKYAKLNYALDRFRADFYGFLDADHRAVPTWLSSAQSALEASGAEAVQSRKAPLATGLLGQTWDATLSHGAFELFNRAQWLVFGRVFFTGSTALFRAAAFDRRRFGACITEDTYLSFDLLSAGMRIAYDPRIGSYEETTPTITSFVLRRRRWAAGHTHAFAAHVRPLVGSTIPWFAKVQALFVGQFFLVPVALAWFLAAQGLYYFIQFTPWVKGSVIVLSAALSAALAVYLSWRRRTKLRDTIVCWFFVAPHVSMAGAFFYLLFERETYYFLTSFPHQERLWEFQGAMLLPALLLVVVAWVRLRPTRLRDLVAFCLTAPLSISLDLLSALLGLADRVAGDAEWSKIDRASEYPSGAPAGPWRARLASALQPRRTSFVFWLPLIAGATALANEVFSVGPCNEERPLLWRPLLATWGRTPLMTVEVERQLQGDSVVVDVVGSIRADAGRRLSLRAFVDKRPLGAPEALPSGVALQRRFRLTKPVGWSSHDVRLTLSGEGVQCSVDRTVATSVVALNSGKLEVNGEPFVVKGMVPTFSSPAIDLSLDQGYRAIKRAGVNALRLYHPPTPAILAAAKRHHLLLIAQPEQATWDALDPASSTDLLRYERRWKELASSVEGFPHALMLSAGNELEIDDRRPERVAAIGNLIDRAKHSPTQVPVSYSTFATFLAYPADVLGINMLDSGATYWKDTVDMLQQVGKPFFASELGGFVAFYESPPAALRAWRLRQQWARVLEAGGLGAIFYASHDNWAQAVPPGHFNDPLTAEMPDDLRGFWDHLNRPKEELGTLRSLLSDLELEATSPRIDAAAPSLATRVRNRRPYALKNIVATLGTSSWALGDLAPGEERTVELPLPLLRRARGYPYLEVPVSFTSHAGLAGEAQVRLVVPDATEGPVVLTPGFELDSRAASRLTGVLAAGDSLELVAPPAWPTVLVNDQELLNSQGRVRLPSRAPLSPVEALEASTDGKSYGPFAFEGSAPRGLVFLRFQLPAPTGAKRLLVLEGVGASTVQVRWSNGETGSFPAHPYRETLIDVTGRTGEVTVRMQRRSLQYLRASESATGKTIDIRLGAPAVFEPVAVDVRGPG